MGGARSYRTNLRPRFPPLFLANSRSRSRSCAFLWWTHSLAERGKRMSMEIASLRPVRDSCAKLRQEWEAMVRNAESASTMELRSLKDRENALLAERSEVQSLNEEASVLRNSIIRLLDEEKEALRERILTEQIKMSIHNQFMQVKQVQRRLASQLVNLRSQLGLFEDQKMGGASDKTILSSMRKAEIYQMEYPRSNYRCINDDVSKTTDERKPSNLFCGEYKTSDTNLKDVGNIEERLSTPIELNGVSIVSPANLTIVIPIDVDEEPGNEPLPDQCLLSDEKRIVNGGDTSVFDCLDHEFLSKRLEMLRRKKWQYIKEEKTDHFSRHRTPNDEHCSVKSVYASKIGDMEARKRKRWQSLERNFLPRSEKQVTIEVALQEDAPGLLEKLTEEGLLQDMILYCACCDDEWSATTDHFKDLELIATKVWGTPSGLFRFPKTGHQQTETTMGKGPPTYCLSCLVFLMDQVKSLRQRGWPVEWLWCRQLYSFIFVFDRHNRIIVERPEYGNATYFFELVESLPVEWQVMRLIKVLSVTSFTKTSLLENRPLQVDLDLTQDECKVLENYGWTQNTGLGSFLNYYARVYHDLKDEENCEWRQKLGRCLMDGYDKGRITTQNTPLLIEGLIHPEEEHKDVKPTISSM